MQKILKISLSVVFLAAGFFLFLPRVSADLIGRESEAKTADFAPARKLYLSNCARCHGADGKSQTDAGRQTDATDLTDQFVKTMSRKRVTNAITHGADGMPAFGKKLSKAEIASLTNYIRTL